MSSPNSAVHCLNMYEEFSTSLCSMFFATVNASVLSALIIRYW